MGNFLHEYVRIVSDPAHMLAEVTFMILVDVLFLGLLWPLLRRNLTKTMERRVMAEHYAIDAEHGIAHDRSPDVDPDLPTK